MSPGRRDTPSGTELVGLGIGLAVAFLLPLVAGLALDRLLHTGAVFLFAGLAVGILLGGALVYTRFRPYL